MVKWVGCCYQWMAHSYVAKCLGCFEVKGWMKINHEIVEKK
jgi:hypothetical protein